MTGIDLTNGTGIPELNRFKEHVWDYKIVVHQGLGRDIMLEGQVDSSKHINLLYDDVERYVSRNLTGAMARRHVCNACHRSCRSDITRLWPDVQRLHDQPSLRVLRRSLPHFRRRAYFANHKQSTAKRSVCERRWCCATCGAHVCCIQPFGRTLVLHLTSEFVIDTLNLADAFLD